MSFRLFERILHELQEQELDEAARDPSSFWATRTIDPDKLYKPWDPRLKSSYDYGPDRSRHSQTISLNDLFQAAETGARTLGNLQCQISKYLGDNGFLLTVTLLQGNFQGQPMPTASAVQSAVTQQLLRTYPSATVDPIDADDLSGSDPSMFRRRVHLRIRRSPTVSEVK